MCSEITVKPAMYSQSLSQTHFKCKNPTQKIKNKKKKPNIQNPTIIPNQKSFSIVTAKTKLFFMLVVENQDHKRMYSYEDMEL